VLLAVAAFVTAACVITADVTAVEAVVAVAVIDAADVTDMGCSKAFLLFAAALLGACTIWQCLTQNLAQLEPLSYGKLEPTS